MASIDLGDKGLSQGDDITPLLERYFESGNDLFIPAGEYRLSNPTSALSGRFSDCSIIGSDDGVILHRDPPSPSNKYRPFLRATSGTVRLENMTIKGVALGRRVDDSDRWRFDAINPDARVEIVNVNQPDGTEECSDALAFYTGSHHEGTVLYKNCYVRGFGNSIFYVNQGYSSGRNNPVILDNCVMVDLTNIRAGTNGSHYRDCTFVYRQGVPGWIDCSKLSRGIRWDNGGNDMVVENCHFYFAPESQLGHGVGGAMEFENYNHSGVVRDIFIYNPNSDRMIKDLGGLHGNWTFSNINVVGPGNRSVDAPVSVGDASPDLVNENAIWMPESQTVRPGNGGGTIPTPTPGDGGVPEGYSLMEIISTTPGEDIEYEFTVDGDAIPATGRNSRISSVGEANVNIINNGDGTVTVTGKTGNEYGDAFAVKGTITSFKRISGNSEVEIFIDGGDETDRFLGDGAGDRNVPPSARFSVAEDGMTLHLDASESNDPDGSIVRYDWHIGEESRSGRIVSIDVDNPGSYDVTLTVEDDDGATSTSSKTVEVEDVRDPGDGFQHYILLETPSKGSFDVGFDLLGTAVLGPESGSSDSIDSNIGSAKDVDGAVHVTAGELAPDGEDDFFYNGYIWDFDPPSGEDVFFKIDDMDRMSVYDFPSDDVFAAVMDSRIEGLVAELDASRSRLSDFTLDRYLWRVNGMELSGESVTLQFEEPGDYPLELWLLTEEGIADPLFTTLTINLPDGEFPPRADFKYSTDGLSASFDASMSLDPNGDIREYVWDFGLSNDSGPKVDYTFPIEGEYNVTLMVYDETGRVDTMTKSVTVSE